jgi:hypothetical protein
MQEKEIIIDSDKFIAQKLAPNYRGDYDCTCEECHLSICWAAFGDYKHCQEVKCINNSFDEGNRNVWVREKGLEDIRPVLKTISCECCTTDFETGDGYIGYYDDPDGSLLASEARDSNWRELGGKWYCPDCYFINDDDQIETNDGKKFDYDTHEEIVVQCPSEPLLNVGADCLKKCDECLIKENGGLYNGPCGYID